MDPGRYAMHQGWDNNSALEGYGAVHEPNFRGGGSYDDRRFFDERHSRGRLLPRNAFHRDATDRDNYPPAPPDAGNWPPSRRRSYEEKYPLGSELMRNEETYTDTYPEMEMYRDPNAFQEYDRFQDSYRSLDNQRDHGFDRHPRFGGRDRDDYAYDDYDHKHRASHQIRGESHERNYDHGRNSYDSDHERSSRRDVTRRCRESRDRDSRDRVSRDRESRDKRGLSWEREESPRGKHGRSRSHGRNDRSISRSRSPRGRSCSRVYHREDSFDDGQYDKSEKRRERDERGHREQYSVDPSATVVVKGLSQKTTEEDLYQILAEWGPLRHVRVIKERNSGMSRGFSFIDFPSVGAARAMMDKIGDDGLVVDGRKLFFEYSSKPTGGASGPFGHDNVMRSGHGSYRSITVPSDWMCTICGCVNFARRVSCFQCNEPRTDDAPPADIALSNPSLGRKGSETGPSHVLVVRGLDENADEEMLRYEFSKHAPIKDLRLVRDKFTHVSRGFAFVHFHSVEDATKSLEATNGTTLEKNGQILRVAYAKSILGPGSGASASSHSSSLAAAAIEAAAFSQQYNTVGWAPKEYNPDDKQSNGGQEQHGEDGAVQNVGSAPQSGFVWDEASGYYYDAASGFYYDGNTGLYYDGNNGLWYSFDNQTQQYVACPNQNGNTAENSKAPDTSSNRKVIISAPAATITSADKGTSLPEAVQAAAVAAIAAEKKEKEKLKEIKLASKTSILANKKKMNNVLTMWKQRSHEGQATRIALDDKKPSDPIDDNGSFLSAQSNKTKLKSDVSTANDNASGFARIPGGALTGVIRGSGRGIVKSDTSYSRSSVGFSTPAGTVGSSVAANADTYAAATPFRTDASALGSYAPATASGTGKRRFSEIPSTNSVQKEQPQTTYRDRAAERRNLYGSSPAIEDLSHLEHGVANRDYASRKGALDPTPFPPGVGGGRAAGDSNANSYEVITADKAIDESNVGNRMLRNMGWQEGLGLGKNGSGMIEPVQAKAIDSRAGLGSHGKQKKVDPDLEAQSGDSYKTLIQKKALARFREMS